MGTLVRKRDGTLLGIGAHNHIRGKSAVDFSCGILSSASKEIVVHLTLAIEGSWILDVRFTPTGVEAAAISIRFVFFHARFDVACQGPRRKLCTHLNKHFSEQQFSKQG